MNNIICQYCGGSGPGPAQRATSAVGTHFRIPAEKHDICIKSLERALFGPADPGNQTFFLMWYDGDPKTGLVTKIRRACQHYAQKYGQPPGRILVHKSMMIEAGGHILGGVRVNQAPYVLPNHFWIESEAQT